MAKTTPTTDDQIAALCRSEIDNAAGRSGGDISQERAEALDYYFGEPYGNEVEGRSSVVTREVMETVEWMLPSLVRIFTDVDNLCKFDPVNADDIEQAKIETEVVNHVYWKQNKGFYNTYTMLKDALLSKTGILKIYWDDTPTETKQSYEGLDEMQLGELMMDTAIEREILEFEQTEQGFDVTFKETTAKGSIKIEPVPPEEFGIARNARSPFSEDSNFCYHRTEKSFSELVEMGYDVETIRGLPYDDDVLTPEQLARYADSDSQMPFDYSSTESMRMYWISECYVRVDRDGDGIAELFKVCMAGGNYSATSSQLLSIEPVDFMPFACVSPILMPHKFYGLSIADLTMDIQLIKSTLTRSMLDNTYLSNNSRTAVNDQHVNLDDLLTSRPGGVVRFKGDGGAGSYITPLAHNPLPPEAFSMMSYLDDVRKQRTGVGNEVGGLDSNALANVNTGVAALAYDAARMKIELIARIIAEVGFRTVFKLIHKLLMTHQDREMVVNVAGEFGAFNPSEWRERVNTTITVGVGTVSRERRMVALDTIMAKQMEQVQADGLGTIVQPHQMYQSLADMTDALGLEASSYFTDPRTVPPAPPQPDVQAELAKTHAQALMMEAQSKLDANQVKVQQMQMDQQIKMRQQELSMQETQLKADIERMKAQLQQFKNSNDSDAKIASLELQMEKQDTEQALARLNLELDAVQSERSSEVAQYKAQLDNITKLVTSETKAESPVDLSEMRDLIGSLMAQNQEMVERIDAMSQSASSPKTIIRDEQGLVVQIGDQQIIRDESGQVMQIG